MNNFDKYKRMRDTGSTPADVYRVAEKDGIGQIASFQMLTQVFDLSLVEAKSVIIGVDTGLSLSEHQGKLAPGLKKALDDLEQDINNGT